MGGGPGTAPPTGLEFSKDDEWIIVFRHLSSGNFFTFYRKSADGSYVVDKEADNNGSDPVSGFFKNLKALPDNLGVERWSVDFEGWVPRVGPDAFRFGFGARLEKGPDGDFMRFSGWHGIYDLRKHAIVKTLSPGEVSTQTEDSEANLNRDYDQLRKALGPAGKKSLQAEQREWLKKRDALPGPKEKLELTTARITELEGRMAKKNP